MYSLNRVRIDKNTEDSILFRLLQDGNKEAFTHIYERYNKTLYVLAYRYLKDKSLSEDAVQHVFVKLWEFHPDMVVTINLKNYLYTMTKNYILNQIRNSSNRLVRSYEIAQSYEDLEDNLYTIIERKELINIFYEAMKLLPEQKKNVCLLKLDERLSNQDIADKMNISINTVKTHYAQALKLLRCYIEKMLIIIFLIILF